MSSFIYDHRESIEKRHYVRQATSRRYWFDFHSRKLQGYCHRFGNDFCLVIYGSTETDDAYIIPYSTASGVFTSETVDQRSRWIGNIVNDLLRLSGRRSLAVSRFYNAFDLLDDRAAAPSIVEDEPIAVEGDGLALSDLTERIAEFNARYREVAPYRRPALSRRIARPGAIADYLKELRGYRCQLCQVPGFLRKNGKPYCEAYHIIELHQLIPGSYCSDNIVVVCPTCRKKLRYAPVEYDVSDKWNVHVRVGDNEHCFERNIISQATSG